MPDAHKGHGSWIERLDSPSDAEGHDSRDPASAGEPASTSGEGDNASAEAGTWQAYLDSTPEATFTPSPDRPDADSGHRPPRGGEPSEPQAAPDPRVTELQRRWLYTQAQLLDDPRGAVIEAGRLIGDAMRLAAGTADQERNRIERRWQAGAHVDTDALRGVMQRHRSLFQYVLAADALVGEVEAVRREDKATATERRYDPARERAAASQDGLAEVLQPGPAERYAAEAPDSHRSRLGSRATRWLTDLGTSWSRGRSTRWAAGAALLLLVGLPAAYGWWRWQRPGSGETATQERALTVEPLPYPWLAQSASTPTLPAGTELDGRTGGGNAAGFESPTVETRSSQADATPRPVAAPNSAGREPTLAAQPTDSEPSIQPTGRQPVPPQLRPAAPAIDAAILTREGAPQTRPEALPMETEPAPPASVQTRIDRGAVAAQPATSAPRQSVDLSQIQPLAGEPELAAAESQSAPRTRETATSAIDEEGTADAPPTPSPAEDREPPPAATEPAVRRGDLVSLSDPEVARPVLLVEPQAEYPAAARRLRREATVELRVLVDERGLPAQIEPAGQSAGLGFDEAARGAVGRARWQPATKDGVPVKAWIQTAVHFQLDGR